jgi:O-antigen/teichoic acid export membrane protein
VFQGLGFGLNHSIRAEGNPRIAMYSMLLGALTNIALDPLFIFGFGMGIRGAALATIISQFVTMLWVLHHFMSGRSKIRFHPGNLRLRMPIVLSIVSIGVSPFMMQIAASIVGIVSNNALKDNGGDMAIGAMTVIQSIVIFFLMPIFGINQGSQPILGFNYGAKAYDRVRKTLRLAIMAASSIAIFAFLLTQFFPAMLIRAFNNEPELLSVAVPGIRIFLSMLPFIGFQIVSANYFQAVGKAPKAIFLSLLRQVIVLIPMLLLLPRLFGLTGVWMAGPVSDLTATVLTAVFLFYELRHLREAHAAQQDVARAEALPVSRWNRDCLFRPAKDWVPYKGVDPFQMNPIGQASPPAANGGEGVRATGSPAEKEVGHERSQKGKTDHCHRCPGGRQQQCHDSRPARSHAAARHMVSGKACAFRQGSHSGAAHARQGLWRVWHLHRNGRHHEVHPGEHIL